MWLRCHGVWHPIVRRDVIKRSGVALETVGVLFIGVAVSALAVVLPGAAFRLRRAAS